MPVAEREMVKSARSNSFSSRKFAVVEARGIKFVLTNCPTGQEVAVYTKRMQTEGVTHLVRVCDSPYSKALLGEAGINIHDLIFDDGTEPPQDVIMGFLSIIAGAMDSSSEGAIAVHCRTGLGRGAVMIALALIERGLSADEAVALIRSRRVGAINKSQMAFLSRYRPIASSKDRKNCIVM